MHAPNRDLQKAAIDGGVRTALKHDSGHKHVSGEAVYVDDIREPPGTLQIYIAMSERAHAAVRTLDVSKVRTAPGVAIGAVLLLPAGVRPLLAELDLIGPGGKRRRPRRARDPG